MFKHKHSQIVVDDGIQTCIQENAMSDDKQDNNIPVTNFTFVFSEILFSLHAPRHFEAESHSQL